MREVFQRDPPKKSHIVANQPDESKVVTECGRVFVEPLGPIMTFEYEPEKAKCERVYNPPASEARCKQCSWE